MNGNKPNFLIFMTDQQLGSTQMNEAVMPNLERLKRHGVMFERAFCTAPHCCPSRASFFTGLYPSEHGVWNNVELADALSHGLNEGVRLFSEDLEEAGYQMYFSGKWHVSAEEGPKDRGFGTWVFPEDHEGRYVRRKRKPDMRDWKWFENGTYTRAEPPREAGGIYRPGFPRYRLYGEAEDPFGDSSVVASALHKLEMIDSERPFCIYVGPLGPHDPYFVPPRYLELYPPDSVKLPDSWSDSMTDKPNLYRRTRERFGQLDMEEQRECLRHYLAFCSYEDALFGRLLDGLEQKGLLNETIVLYVSDHGDYAGAHGLWTKGLPCFEEAYHICSVMGYGGISAVNSVVRQRISLTDYAPTFLELAGITVERIFSGASLVPFLEGRVPDSWRDETYTQTNGNECYGIQRSIFTDKYHFVWNGFDYDELYDLKMDPDCVRNVAREKAYSGVVREMYEKLWSFAYRHSDMLGDSYITTALAQYGPGIITTAPVQNRRGE